MIDSQVPLNRQRFIDIERCFDVSIADADQFGVILAYHAKDILVDVDLK